MQTRPLRNIRRELVLAKGTEVITRALTDSGATTKIHGLHTILSRYLARPSGVRVKVIELCIVDSHEQRILETTHH